MNLTTYSAKDSSLNFLHEKDILKSYNDKTYPFNKILAELFKVESIEQLHKKISSKEDFNADLGKDSESFYHKLFYKEIKNLNSNLRKTWEVFISEEIRNHFPNENTLIIQKLPNIRIHIPNGLAIKRWHCDSDKDHKHPIGEINCVMPFTKMYDTNSLWRESNPSKGDFKPFNLKFGELVYWNGNTCIHGNKINNTEITRISFDFRIFFKDKYEKYISNTNNNFSSTATMGTKFVLGAYYKELV